MSQHMSKTESSFFSPLFDFCSDSKIPLLFKKHGISLPIVTSWHCTAFIVLSSVGLMGKYILKNRTSRHTGGSQQNIQHSQGTFKLKTVKRKSWLLRTFIICSWKQPHWLILTVKSDGLPVNSLVNPADPFVTSDNSFSTHRQSTQLTNYMCVCTQYLCLCVGVQQKLHLHLCEWILAPVS